MISPSDLSLPSKFLSYRDGQDSTILSILSSSFRFSLLSAPPGSGKSLVYASIAKLFHCRTLIIVGTKPHEDQLLRDFSSAGVVGIRGHSNYSCADTDFDDLGELIDLECHARKTGQDCLYHDIAVPLCLGSDIVVTNLAHWVQLQKSDSPDRLGKFGLIVIDEAHSTPDLLVDLLSIKLYQRYIKSSLKIDLPALDSSVSSWVEWARHALEICRESFKEIRDSDRSDGYKGPSKEQLRLLKLGKDLGRIVSIPQDGVKWVSQKTDRGVGIQLSPVWAGPYAEQYLYRGIPRVLLCSGTLSPLITRYLGIPESDHDWIEMDSKFSPKRRPFIYVPTTSVSYKMGEGDLRQLVNKINQVVEGRLDRKGIIHSVSYDYAERIAALFKYPDLLITHGRGGLQRALDRFLSDDPPSVIISPSLNQGFDFPDDLARYQIIIKVPFPDRRNPLTKARCQEDKGYGDYLVANYLMQTYGRLMRSVDDWGETFIFDTHWRFFRKYQGFPMYVRRAFVESNRVPEALEL